VDAGQVPVEHDHVVVDHRRSRQRVGPVVRDVDGNPLAAKHARDRLSELDVIFDYQDPHQREPEILLGQA